MSNTMKADTEAKEEEGGAVEADICCANCGIAAVDDIKLEECTDCDLVKYCGDKCREEHRKEREEERKKRKGLLRDRKLFTQPDATHHGECPLCFLPLPIDPLKSGFYTCCSNMVCQGCVHAHLVANIHDEDKAGACPFCREPAVDGKEIDNIMERLEANDPVALRFKGIESNEEGDYDSAFEYLTKAADLGDVEAYYQLGLLYEEGEGVEKDEEKMVYHYEKAAIGGHPYARHNLAGIELRKGNIERSAKHLIIAANLGYDESMKSLWKAFKFGHITKEDLDATLRTHHAVINAMKSEQRDEAKLAFPSFN